MAARIAQGIFFFFSYDVDVAEAKVLRFGLCFVREVSLSPVTVESDSLLVIFLVLDRLSTALSCFCLFLK